MQFLRKNWFVIGIFAALLLGVLLSNFGVAVNRGSYATTTIIVALFIISGLKLPSESIRSGMRDVRLHLYIQLFIFILHPVFFLVTAIPFRNVMDGQMIVGFYALACLPTTISSCIVFTQMAGGNVVAAIFNAALANFAGVFISPLLLSLLLRSTGEPLPLDELLNVLKNLSLKMLVPIFLGQIGRRYIKSWIEKQKKKLGVVSNTLILAILFFAFAKTAANPSFASHLRSMVVPFVYLAVSHLVLLALAFLGAKILKFNLENTITVLFTAPQKTLAMGVPLLTTFFATNPEMLGIALLPVVFYHPWQLIVAGFLPRFTESLRKKRLPL